MRRAVEVAAGDAGRLDFAVNSAGVEAVDHSMKYELKLMSAQGHGSIVNISSGAGLVGVAGFSGYVASKHAEIGLTKSAALDYASYGIRVNAICPGLVNTPLVANEKPEMRDGLISAHPLGRIAEPEEIADAIVWLCSDKSSFVTGIGLPVDGGYTAR